jgi:antitoxin component of MazEF toxin-antitoxin module
MKYILNEDGVITIPEELIKELNWDENTTLSITQNENTLEMREKTDWTVDELTDNIEQIIARVNKTKKHHSVLHKGKIILITPIDHHHCL